MTSIIRYVPGSGRSNKAVFLVGSETLPMVVVTRLLNGLNGFSGAKLDRAFYQGLSKYPKVLDVLDSCHMTPEAAIESFKKLQEENRPKKAARGTRPSKIQKTAEVFAKGICRRFKGTPEEMVTSFLEIVAKPEFKKETIDVISAYEKNFGKTNLGHIKTSVRKGNPAAQKALAMHRKARKK